MGTLISSVASAETVRKLTDLIGVNASEFLKSLNGAEQFIHQHFGQTGVYAAYIALIAITLYITAKLLKISFAILKYVVVPSVALAFVASLFLPFSFFYMLPVTLSLSSVALLFRG
ncbi:MAG TPA: hypothetical protein VLB27_02730 [candidate division Zixibacteria bacterium]|nr:hypothetical protein [candidate division Zixibacteria bacterium]